MSATLVIGSTSFLAKRFINEIGVGNIRAISHREIDNKHVFDGVDCIVNFAYDKKLNSEPYSAEYDVDRTIVDKISGLSARYIMLSTRKVYQDGFKWNSVEDYPVSGDGQYGKNRVITESYLKNILGERLTILRLGNVIGYEVIDGRKTFMGLLLNRLVKHGEILFDTSPFVRKDFLTDAFFVRALRFFIYETRESGVFNLSSGIPVEVGRIAMWILEGYGRGQLRVESPGVCDEFLLDVGKLKSIFCHPVTVDEIRDYCNLMGKRLAYE